MRFSVKTILLCALTFGTPALAYDTLPEAVTVTDNGNETIISGPNPQAAVVLVAGAFIKPTGYEDLAKAIVSNSNQEIAVFIPHFFGDFAIPGRSGKKIDAAIGYLAQRGIASPSLRVFAAGHSHGGMAVNDTPVSHDLGGLILLASYLPHSAVSSQTIANFPKPVLMLGGELDGLTGINYVARDALTVAAMARTDVNIVTEKPVVLLRGVTHRQFADGSADDADSIPPEVSLVHAHDAMAKVIVDFIASRGALTGFNQAAGKSHVKAEVAATTNLLEPYRLAQVTEDMTCAEAQRAAVELDAPGWDAIRIESKFYHHGPSDALFILDKSSISKAAQGFKLHLPVLIDSAIDMTDISKNNYLAPRALFCKMRTASKIAAETGLTATKPDLNCAELNQRVIASTLATITDAAQRARFSAKYGDPETWALEALSDDASDQVQYGPITIRSEKKATGQSWIRSRFGFASITASSWQLTTGDLITADDVKIALFAGAHYCKILPPARIVEWATIFGLK